MSQGHSTSRYPIHTNPIGACISLFKDEKTLTLFAFDKPTSYHAARMIFFILFYKKVNKKPSDYRG